MNFDNIRKAWRRAKSFKLVGSVQFTPYNPVGAEIAAANYCLLIDAEGDLVDDLVLFDSWAQSINRACDARMIVDSPDIQHSLRCFASRLWVDPERL